MSSKKRAVVLFSGGLDSSTILLHVINEGFEAFALTFAYDQSHEIEVAKAKAFCQKYPTVKHLILNLELGKIGGSELTDANYSRPEGSVRSKFTDDIPATYVPARNTIFLSYALSWAEKLGASDIFIGVNAIDYSGYPDCRPEYIAAFQNLANLATRSGLDPSQTITIRAPFVSFKKSGIIAYGLKMGIDYADTISCYHPEDGDRPCGKCDSCILRNGAFAELGMVDPALIQS